MSRTVARCKESTEKDTVNEHFEINPGDPDSNNPAGLIVSQSEDANVTVESVRIEDEHSEQGTPRKSRKRTRTPHKWKANKRKRRREQGQSYIDTKGRERPSREIKSKKDCTKCRFQCCINISENEREEIFRKFWTLSAGEKAQFYSKTTTFAHKKRTRTTSRKSRKEYSFKYFFFVHDQRIRVCKDYYLQTLDISQKRVEYFHKSRKSSVTGMAKSGENRGKHVKKTVSDDLKQVVRDHIEAFPRVESHYCRVRTKKRIS